MKIKTILYFGFLLVTITLLQVNNPSPSIASSSDTSESTDKLQNTDKQSVPASFNLIAEVLMRIQLDYVDLPRLNPNKMFDGVIHALTRSIPEVQITAAHGSSNTKVELQVDEQKHSYSVESIQNLYHLSEALKPVYQFLLKHRPTDVEVSDIQYSMIRGMLRHSDPHSSILPAEDYGEFKISTGGNFGGVGMMIGIRDEHLTVIAPIAGTPASRAGIKAKDRIIRIEDEDTINMSLTDTVNKLRGPAGSDVTIYVTRSGVKEPKKITLTRAIIEINSVDSVDFNHDHQKIRYLRIKSFQENTYDELVDKVEDLSVDGMILDLRNNPGGLLDQAVQIADLFLPDGKTIVSTVSSDQQQDVYKAHWIPGNQTLFETPIVVLINSGSASASEIVAAALKNNKRALVIGERTFGKGSVQSVWELDNKDALKLTTAQYLTPGDQSIQSVGVAPHILLYPMLVSKDQMILTQHEEGYTEKDLKGQFDEWSKENKEKPLFKLPYLTNKKELEEDEDELEELSGEGLQQHLQKDFIVQFAKKILNASVEPDYPKLMENAETVFQQSFDAEEQKLTKALKAFEIDWKAYPKIEDPTLEIDVVVEILEKPTTEETPKDSSETKVADSEKKDTPKHPEIWLPAPTPIPLNSKIRLRVTATNKGSEAISRLQALSKSKHLLFNDWELVFGSLKPEESKTWSLPITIPKYMQTSITHVEFQFRNKKQSKLGQSSIFLGFQQLPEPKFTASFKVIDDGSKGSEGNSNGVIDSGELIVVEMNVRNIGNGISEETTALLKKYKVEVPMILKEGRVVLGKLKPGEEKKAHLKFQVRKLEEPLKLKMVFDVVDTAFHDRVVSYTVESTGSLPEASVEAPSINLTSPLPNQKLLGLSYDGSYLLEGNATDDQQLKDLFIFVNEKKVLFQKAPKDPKKPLYFKLKLNLEKGYNGIVIFARDQDNTVHHKELQIWYSPQDQDLSLN